MSFLSNYSVQKIAFLGRHFFLTCHEFITTSFGRHTKLTFQTNFTFRNKDYYGISK